MALFSALMAQSEGQGTFIPTIVSPLPRVRRSPVEEREVGSRNVIAIGKIRRSGK
jgi:hypothetical protein